MKRLLCFIGIHTYFKAIQPGFYVCGRCKSVFWKHGK